MIGGEDLEGQNENGSHVTRGVDLIHTSPEGN